MQGPGRPCATSCAGATSAGCWPPGCCRQFGDGVFQAALAGTVLFNPQRAADPVDVAAGFAVLLLPYSLVGPFAGVWLDRWSRRQVLLRANVVRAGLVAVVAALVLGRRAGHAFYVAGLAVFSVNRFVLVGAVRRRCRTPPTSRPWCRPTRCRRRPGAVATVVGGGAALGAAARRRAGDGGYAALALARGAALPGRRGGRRPGSPRAYLGPGPPGPARPGRARDVAAGHGRRRPARAGRTRRPPPRWRRSACTGSATACLTLMTLLLYRNTFAADGGLFPGGLVGLGEVRRRPARSARCWPPRSPRRRCGGSGKRRWVTGLLAVGGVAQMVLGAAVPAAGVVAAGLVLGFVAQGVKICVDTTLQETVDDDFRGRVFSVYDTLFNVTFVVALLVGRVRAAAVGDLATRCCSSSASATCSPPWPSRGGPGTAWPTIRTGCPTRRAARPRPRRGSSGPRSSRSSLRNRQA